MESTKPIFYLDEKGQRQVGYNALLLPGVAEVYLKMRDAHLASGAPVPKRYVPIVAACDILMRGQSW